MNDIKYSRTYFLRKIIRMVIKGNSGILYPEYILNFVKFGH